MFIFPTTALAHRVRGVCHALLKSGRFESEQVGLRHDLIARARAVLLLVGRGELLRFGGAALFRKLRPFFIGLILGQFTAVGFWLILDIITGTTGNNLYWV